MQSLRRLPTHGASEQPAAQLAVSLDVGGGRITLVGELDRQTAHQRLDAARALSATDHAHWVIDARDLHFCDANGLRVLSATYPRAIRSGATVRVVGAGRWLRRALATIRLHHHVFKEDSSESVGAQGHVPAVYPLAKSHTL